jgi:hypothetical protein
VNWESIQTRIDSLIREYRMAILGTLLVHAIFMSLLVLFEVTKPIISEQDFISVEIEPDQGSENELSLLNNPQLTGNEDAENLKNIEGNAGDQNKSFEDYYREAKEVVDNGKPKENFKANNYEDKRWLAKDYSKEKDFFTNDAIPNNQNNTSSDNNKSNSNSKNTYAGNTIITYNVGGRKATKLPIPAYQCLGSGEVNIEINVNQKGIITSVTILSSNTTLNESCLADAAYKAALSSKFAIDLKAPSSQKGTILYKFVKQ